MDSKNRAKLHRAGTDAAGGAAGMRTNLGAIPLSTDILEKANIGLWAFELDEGREPRMYVDNVMLGLIGLREQTTPEKTYHAWYDRIDPEHYDEVSAAVDQMVAGVHSEVQYPWHHPDGRVMTVRCGGVRNPAYTQGIRIEGTHMDVTEVLHVEKQKDALLDGLAREYHTVWLMDGFGDHRVHLYRSTGKTTVQSAVKLGLDEPCYDSSVVKYIMNTVYEEDRERVLEATKYETIERETPDVGTYVITYRRYNDQGTVDYHQMCFAKAVSSDGRTNYIMAYRDADKTMREQLRRQEQMDQYNKIINALAAEYSSVYVVNLADAGLYVAKMSGRITGMFGDTFRKSDYEQAYRAYVNSAVCEEEKEEMRKVLSVAYIREHLMGVSSFVKYYINNNGEYTEMKVVKTDDDDEVVMGFGVKDAEIRAQLAMTEEMKRNNSLVNILSDDYLSVFVLDCETDTYTVVAREDADSVALNHASTAEAASAMAAYIQNYVHPDDRAMLAEAIDYRTVMEKLAHANRYRVTFRTDYDGQGYRYVDFVAAKDGAPDSPFTSVAMGFQDVDERVRKEKENQEKLEEALSEAQAANNAKTAFLSSMSHDIRTPLNAITGYTAMAKKRLDSVEHVSDYLDKIDVSGHQLLELINQVLEMSRIESGKVVLQEEPVDIIERAYDMRTLSGTEIESKDLNYALSMKHVKHRYVLTDGARMNQIIMNILGNAIKYTPEGGSIAYTVEEKPYEAGRSLYSFRVADTGIGMSEEFQKHIYEEFTRESTSTVSHIQGTGLGMPIVKKLVDLMHGTIELSSAPGAGTTVTVTVPMKWDLNAEKRAEKPEEHRETDFKGKRLLLAEDNEMNREIAGDILEEAGFTIDMAEDGDIAVKKVRAAAQAGDPRRYDAILMDIQMPRMNGYEAARAIRALPGLEGCRLPIVALSANAFEEDRQKSLAAGMDDHVSKPIDILQLKETLAKYL